MRLVCVVVALLLPATAQAHFSRTSRVHNTRHVAQSVWGEVCDVGTMAVPIVRMDVPEPFWGQAFWFGAAPPFTDCTVHVDDRRWASEPLCALVAGHEFGHLAGQPHSLDPASVMFAHGLPPFPPCYAANVRRIAQSYP